MTEDRILEPVLEPLTSGQYVNLASANDSKIPHGWSRHVSNLPYSTDFFNAGRFFTHAKDNSTFTFFKHPVPLREDLSAQSLLANAVYMTCSTSTASLFPTSILTLKTYSQYVERAALKISAFEDKIFKRGPSDGKACPILVLQQPNGAFAGLLRLTTSHNIDKATPLELIAISTGSATVRDVRKSFE
jgi:hypothetical protein